MANFSSSKVFGDLTVARRLEVLGDKITSKGFIDITRPSSNTKPLLNLNATTNDGSNSTLLGGYINSNTTDRYFVRFEGNNGVNFQISTSGNVTATEFIETSSVHLKENIRDLGTCLDKVIQLKPKIYDRKDGSNKDEVGLIAQDVENVIPELSDGETVKYTRLTVYLINAVKELTERVEVLEQEIANGNS